ncbi:hypothetical protein LCGC14_0989820 [marine sediment metagenome]|uniref:Uncharacterized protein n=1 Tax=marine sediment metagenome TaxID=412755 RepID=A0A0F9NAN8_9ZZZZ
MGFYINPPNGAKEDWLHERGEPFFNPKWPPSPGKSIVCLVFNPSFSAAAVAFSEEEFDVFNDVQDPRVKLWYQVPTDAVVAICPEVAERLSAS